jgi:D-sedoheptulose 7-phosphate isomerase
VGINPPRTRQIFTGRQDFETPFMSSYIETFLAETVQIAQTIDRAAISAMLDELRALRDRGGRLFLLGVGGSAGNASHAVNDFRKIANIESYAPSDNVSELTARINDDGWDTCYSKWLEGSKLSAKDAVMIFSVGGGSDTTSLNLVRAMELADKVGAPILSVVSRDGGKAREHSKVCVLVPVIVKERITPHAEAWQAVVWHLLVNGL